MIIIILILFLNIRIITRIIIYYNINILEINIIRIRSCYKMTKNIITLKKIVITLSVTNMTTPQDQLRIT